MTSLFFFLTIVFFFYELNVLLKPGEELARINRISTKDYYTSDAPSSEKAGSCMFALLQMSYFLWTMLGIAFAWQWVSFLVILVVGFIFGFTRRGMKKAGYGEGTPVKALKVLDALVSMLILLDIFMTHFRTDYWGEGIIRRFIGL